ncbi:hypothetical protein [Dyella sp. C9]|uniref:hypothetical protein n=1 Tax=Dyella sp. C9 TaxID=2202154 RepID=UPI000DEEDBC1|nr:hypothetical protein [Dyella sp. C9]
MQPNRLALPCLLATALLAGCGKTTSDAASTASTATTPAPSGDAPTAPERRDAKALDAYQLIDLSPALYSTAEYTSLSTQVRAAFWSGTPKQLDKLAYDYITDYRHEPDSFKRSDMLKTLTPELEHDYADAQARQDYAVRTNTLMQVYPYDAALGGFRVSFASNEEGSAVGIFRNAGTPHNEGAWRFRFIGVPVSGPGKDFIYHPRDEAEARAIEATLAAQRSRDGDSVNTFSQYEGHVLGASWGPANDDTAVFGVDAITAVDRKTGKPLLTIGGKALGPIEVKCQSTRDALKLASPRATGGGWDMSASSESPC